MAEWRLFDAHFHVIDPRFPLVPNDGYLPTPFTCEDYLARMQGHDLVGGAVVSGSFQAFDQTYLIDALARLGAGFVGVTQLPADTADERILELDRAGVRGVRFNLHRGGSENVRQLDAMARRVYEIAGWHVELYVDSAAVGDLFGTLAALPVVSIDHLGLSASGLGTLLRLAEQGVRVKASGFGRVDFDVRAALRDLHSANPEALMFGTDLPSTRAPRPFREEDIRLVRDVLPDAGARRVLHDNAAAFFRVVDR